VKLAQSGSTVPHPVEFNDEILVMAHITEIESMSIELLEETVVLEIGTFL
jgi:RIO-like serine/threonine protein kinase